TPFFVAAALAAVNFLWAARSLPEPARHEERERPRGRSYGDAFRLPRLAFYLVIFLIVGLAFSQIEATFSIWATATLGFGSNGNPFAFTYIGLGLSFVQGFGTRRLSKKYGEVPLIVAGCFSMAIGAGLIMITRNWMFLAVPITFISAGSALNSPSLTAAISK